MPVSSHPELALQTARTSQIIVGAMLLGVCVFAGIVVVLGMNKPVGDLLVGYVGLGMAAIALVAWFIVPDAMARIRIAQLPRVENRGVVDQRLYPVYLARAIVGAALLEGAIFFNLICYQLAGQQWSLAAAGLLMLVMLASFPTLARVNRWVENQTVMMELNKSLGPKP